MPCDTLPLLTKLSHRFSVVAGVIFLCFHRRLDQENSAGIVFDFVTDFWGRVFLLVLSQVIIGLLDTHTLARRKCIGIYRIDHFVEIYRGKTSRADRCLFYEFSSFHFSILTICFVGTVDAPLC